MNKKSNIVYLVDSLKRGGVQQGVLLQVARLDKAKYNVEVWSLRSGGLNWELADAFEEHGIPIALAPVKHYSDRRGIIDLARKLIEHKVDLLNTKSFYPNIVGRIAAYLADTPIVIANYHSTYKHRWTKKYIAYEKTLRWMTDRFVCVSKAARDHLQPLLRLPKEKISIVYNCVDLERYDIDESKEVLRAKIGLPNDCRIVAMIGRLNRVKQIPLLFDAIETIKNEIPDALFLIVGDGEEREALDALVGRKKLRDAVRFLGSRSDVPEILKAVDCLVMPSIVEGFPRVLLEAFASGTPVVATPAGGIPELLVHEKNGLLIPFSDPVSLAKAVVRTLSSPEETQERSRQALEDVREFSLEKWVAQTEELFDPFIAAHEQEMRHFGVHHREPSDLALSLRYLSFRLLFSTRRLFI